MPKSLFDNLYKNDFEWTYRYSKNECDELEKSLSVDEKPRRFSYESYRKNKQMVSATKEAKADVAFEYFIKASPEAEYKPADILDNADFIEDVGVKNRYREILKRGLFCKFHQDFETALTTKDVIPTMEYSIYSEVVDKNTVRMRVVAIASCFSSKMFKEPTKVKPYVLFDSQLLVTLDKDTPKVIVESHQRTNLSPWVDIWTPIIGYNTFKPNHVSTNRSDLPSGIPQADSYWRSIARHPLKALSASVVSGGAGLGIVYGAVALKWSLAVAALSAIWPVAVAAVGTAILGFLIYTAYRYHHPEKQDLPQIISEEPFASADETQRIPSSGHKEILSELANKEGIEGERLLGDSKEEDTRDVFYRGDESPPIEGPASKTQIELASMEDTLPEEEEEFLTLDTKGTSPSSEEESSNDDEDPSPPKSSRSSSS